MGQRPQSGGGRPPATTTAAKAEGVAHGRGLRRVFLARPRVPENTWRGHFMGRANQSFRSGPFFFFFSNFDTKIMVAVNFVIENN